MADNCILETLEELIRRRKMLQRRILSQSSMYVGQPEMLRFVRQHPGCSQKQMADNARITPASVAASFKRLEKNGLISRRTDTADTRCNRVYITAAGERELDFCQDALDALDRDLFEGIDEDALFEFKKVLDAMLDHLKER